MLISTCLAILTFWPKSWEDFTNRWVCKDISFQCDKKTKFQICPHLNNGLFFFWKEQLNSVKQKGLEKINQTSKATYLSPSFTTWVHLLVPGLYPGAVLCAGCWNVKVRGRERANEQGFRRYRGGVKAMAELWKSQKWWKEDKEGLFWEGVGKYIAGSCGIGGWGRFLSLSALNCLPCLSCFKNEEGIS